jgi:hypothetical protein
LLFVVDECRKVEECVLGRVDSNEGNDYKAAVKLLFRSGGNGGMIVHGV